MQGPPSGLGTFPLPGLATDNAGYQTASSGSDEAATGRLDDALETLEFAHRTQQYTTNETNTTPTISTLRQPPASPGAPTAAARGLTHALCDRLALLGLRTGFRKCTEKFRQQLRTDASVH